MADSITRHNIGKHLQVSPKEFLHELFRGKRTDEVIYLGDKFKFNPTALRTRNRPIYTNLSTFRRNEAGEVERTSKYVDHTYAVVLDDIGTKYPVPKLPPSWILESSEENYQYGYFFTISLPAQEGAVFMARLRAREVPLGDTGAMKVNQLIRVPAGINGKKLDDGTINMFKVGLTHWAPEVHYSAAELAELWELPELDPDARVGGVWSGNFPPMPVEQMKSLPVLSYLDVVSMEPGKVHVICPNAAAHGKDTGEKQSSLLIDETGHHEYNCFHDSCRQGFHFDSWLMAQATAQLPALPPGGDPGVHAVTGVPPAEERAGSVEGELVDQLVMLTAGSGGYYDMARDVVMNKTTLDAVYAHVQSRPMVSTLLARSEGKQVADYVGWAPIAERFFQLGSHRIVNRFRGIDVAPVAGVPEEWLRILQHVYGDLWELVADHLAFSLQRPTVKIRWQVLCFGAPRTGKTLSLRPLERIWGQSYQQVTNEMIDTGWGDMFDAAKMVAVEEVWNNERRFFNKLKPKLANDGVETLNIKSQGVRRQQNLYSMYLFTNHADAMRFEADEDKLLVIEGPAHALEKAVYDRFAERCEDPEFIGQCYGWLMARDISGFSFGRLPVRTEAMYKMVDEARPDYEHALDEMIAHKETPFDAVAFRIEDVRNFLKNKDYRCSRRSLVRVLRRHGYVNETVSKKVKGQTKAVRVWLREEVYRSHRSSDLYDAYMKGASFMPGV